MCWTVTVPLTTRDDPVPVTVRPLDVTVWSQIFLLRASMLTVPVRWLPLMTTVREKPCTPSERAMYTSAMPPVAMRALTR